MSALRSLAYTHFFWASDHGPLNENKVMGFHGVFMDNTWANKSTGVTKRHFGFRQGWRQDNGNRSNQESKFDFLATPQCLVKINEALWHGHSQGTIYERATHRQGKKKVN